MNGKINKKAQVKYVILHIFRVMFLIIALGAVVLLVRSYIINSLPTDNLQRQILFNRLYYSPNTLSYYDADIGRYYPGIIDINNINTERLEKAINYSYKKQIAARVSIQDIHAPFIFGNKAYINQKYFDFWNTQIEAGVTGPGSGGKTTKRVPVVFRTSSGEFYRGILKIEIITPNS